MKTNIIFDFDGVMADSFEAAFSVAKLQWPNITRKEYGDLFMGNYYDSLSKITTPLILVDFDEEYGKREKPIVEGIKDVILNLHKKHKLYIISSSHTGRIKSWLEKYSLANIFDEILGKEIKSKVEKIKKLKEKNKPNDRYVFITDTVGDILEAEIAGIPKENIIAVTWGFHDKNELKKYSKNIVNNPEEIINFISKVT